MLLRPIFALITAAAAEFSAAAAETVEKVAQPLFREELHEIFASISYEIVGKNFVRSVISDVHAAGNDGISFYSVVCGRRNSLQEGFFDKLSGGRRVFCGRRSR